MQRFLIEPPCAAPSTAAAGRRLRRVGSLGPFACTPRLPVQLAVGAFGCACAGVQVLAPSTSRCALRHMVLVAARVQVAQTREAEKHNWVLLYWCAARVVIHVLPCVDIDSTSRCCSGALTATNG
ncbi:hypothetical protein EON67_12160 [archaeon]|nr:MAG: hypothetical protein EON67_12160 [archaeon]